MKDKDELRELRGLNEKELAERSSSIRHELMNLRFRHASGQLDQTAQLATLRRRVSRIETVLAEKKSEAKTA